ncbi:MAG TPA: alpha-amylase family glycosyl hydrolase [Pyrinomonadaceae bacterium]|nr:alpha-amylase family glycosyl hydrolase [Pyrinomonadaceae bacterium]
MKPKQLTLTLLLLLFVTSASFAQQARAVPDWVRDGVIYEIYPRAFSQQGNFNAITARLDELKDLGVTILWLMPVHPIGQEKKKGTIGSPYAVRDYYEVNPDYGSGDDLHRLINEAHRRGLKVIIDIVANHTSWDSLLMKQHPEFYKRDAQGNIMSPHDWYDVAALNYENPGLRRYMTNVMRYWLRDFGVDGFRCDVAGEVPTDFWENARVALEKEKSDIVMLAEAHKPELQVKAFDLDYSWPLHSALTNVLQGRAPASELRKEWEKEVREWPKGALHMRFSDNHDERRAIARFGERAALAASAFVFTLDGVPMIYNGMEVGDTTESGAPALFEKLPIFWAIAERRPEFPKFYKEIMAQRRASKALQRGTLEWVSNSDESRIVSFVRRFEGEEVLVAINFSSVPFSGTVRGKKVSLGAWESRITNNAQATARDETRWPTAAKDGFGTAVTLGSKVWFTLARGVMTEVFYPTIDAPKIKTLQLQVHMGDRVETELHDTVHHVEFPSAAPLTFRQVNTAKSSQYTITKTYVTDPQRNSVLIDVQFQSQIPAWLSAHYEPSQHKSSHSALVSNCGSRPQTTLRCTITLGFGANLAAARNAARASLARGFQATRTEYEAGWNSYISTLPRVEAKYQRQFNMAAMVLRGLEDKTFRGAVIASPSVPWGGGSGPNVDESTISGYHAVWSRDLYHVATAFIALGDRVTANRLLDYVFRVQQKRDGSFPRNSWVDGRPIGDALQMDQVALPLVLAWQLGRDDAQTWRAHVKPAADLIVRRGPKTDQDRWEERSGYFPATVAAEIAGLVCAAEIAKNNGDSNSASTYLKTADDWRRNLEPVNTAVIDAGFLELVRLGIKRANDPFITDALAVVDQKIRVTTPAGEAWYRYNGDRYGETPEGGDFDGRNGVGRLWTFLTGERGEYEIAAGDLAAARKRLDALAAFANDGLMIPEQVWDRLESPGEAFRFGEGTGSATPLAWSMAQFIRLAMNLQHGRNLETPAVVAQRYVDRND